MKKITEMIKNPMVLIGLAIGVYFMFFTKKKRVTRRRKRTSRRTYRNNYRKMNGSTRGYRKSYRRSRRK